jgi:hypothetical protein
VFILTLVTIVVSVTTSSTTNNELYLNEWSIHVPGGKLAADKFAQENGFVNLGEIIPGSDEYHMRYPRRSKRSVDQDHHIQKRILEHPDVSMAEQLVEKKRVKRDLVYPTRYITNLVWIQSYQTFFFVKQKFFLFFAIKLCHFVAFALYSSATNTQA